MNAFMKANKIHILLLSLLALGLLSACSGTSPEANTPEEPLGPPDRIDVVYFYDSKACLCYAVVGADIQSTLFLHFGGELTSGKLTLQCIDLNSDNNTAIANKYGATGTPLSLFINIVRGETEEIIAVPEIWLVKDDNRALDRLVSNRVSEYLAEQE